VQQPLQVQQVQPVEGLQSGPRLQRSLAAAAMAGPPSGQLTAAKVLCRKQPAKHTLHHQNSLLALLFICTRLRLTVVL
jgi:hypothetical protein